MHIYLCFLLEVNKYCLIIFMVILQSYLGEINYKCL